MISRRGVLAAGASLAVARPVLGAPELEVVADYPQQLQTPLEYFDRLITPNEVFFVRSHFGPPRLDRERKLTIGGLVEQPLVFSASELEKLPQTTLTAVLQCAGNGRALMEPPVAGAQWIHGAMGQATWTGVRLKDLLAKAKVKAGAAHVHTAGADLAPKPLTPPFHRSIPLERALHPDTLVATRMNGEPLSLLHGAPVRLVVPGWAFDHWIKWLTKLELAANEFDGFFVKKGYRMPPKPVAPGVKVPPEQMEPVMVMPVKSIIARPLDGSTSKLGRQEVVGVAFSGQAAIKAVEVSVDGGKRWAPAKLDGPSGLGRWQLFRFSFDARAGAASAMVRATDALGAVQPEQHVWNPAGYFFNAWHRVAWTVA